MKALPFTELEPTYPELCAALQKAARELLPFVICAVCDSLRAEGIVSEVLWIAMENKWLGFSVSGSEEFTHQEFREDIYSQSWKKVSKDLKQGKLSKNLSFGETAMPFYQLDWIERSALYLRMRTKFSYPEIKRILQLNTEKAAEELVVAARKKILGRDLHPKLMEQGGGLWLFLMTSKSFALPKAQKT